MLLLKNLVFTVLVPGTVAVFVPYRILTSSGPLRLRDVGILHGLGLVPIVLGGVVYLWCIWDFGYRGRGTPAPIDPPKELVVGGPYRVTRNPMYVTVLCVVLGESVLFGSRGLLLYAVVLLAAFHLFVVFYEEPTLRRRFGSSYDGYCAKVPRWLFMRRAA